MNVSGPISMKSKSKEDGHDIAIVGTGTMKLQMTANWIKVADKTQ